MPLSASFFSHLPFSRFHPRHTTCLRLRSALPRRGFFSFFPFVSIQHAIFFFHSSYLSPSVLLIPPVKYTANRRRRKKKNYWSPPPNVVSVTIAESERATGLGVVNLKGIRA